MNTYQQDLSPKELIPLLRNIIINDFRAGVEIYASKLDMTPQMQTSISIFKNIYNTHQHIISNNRQMLLDLATIFEGQQNFRAEYVKVCDQLKFHAAINSEF